MCLVATMSLSSLVSPSLAAEPSFVPVKRYQVVRKMVFPVVGLTKFWSGFGDCRDNCTREHHGIDILTYGWKGLPVVAAHAGTVTLVTYDRGNAGCSVRIRGRDRWETRYLHMNNDFPGTDDIGFPCVAPGIEVGATVEAGQIIGWIGDSGNSEDTVPHIHFELRNRSGYPIDPYRSLRNARRVSFEWLPSDATSTSILLSQSLHPSAGLLAYAVSSDEVSKLSPDNTAALKLRAPLIVVDEQNPQPGIDEIKRLGPSRIVVFSGRDVEWLTDQLGGGARIVEVASLPTVEARPVTQMLDGEPTNPDEAHARDRFSTIIGGDIDRVWRGYQEPFETFIADHRALVLTSSLRGTRNLGLRSGGYPGKYAARDLVWWDTGDGWIGTESGDDAPPQGFAYVTERLATPWTLAFLASLAEAPQIPRWRE